MGNSGQYKKRSPRFVESGWFGRVHVLVYNREDRTWGFACTPGDFPTPGSWVPVGSPQPEVTCKACNKLVWT